MNTKISNLKNLRVYRHLSISQLLSHLVCNRIMKSRPLVAAAPSIYQYLCYFPGKTLTNLFISSTFNRMFTLGNSLEHLAHNSQHLAKQNIPLMVDFCAQGIAGEPKNEENLNQNAREFTRSAIWAAKHKGYLFSIKISGLIDFKLLLKYNNAVELRDVLWRQSCENGVFSAQKLFQNCKRIYQGLSEYDFQAYLKQIHNFSGDAKTFKIDQTQFKMNHQPYYLYQPSKNQILLIKLMFPLDSTEQGYMLALLRRLDQILEAEFQNPNQVRVLVDAQQSYIQRALESLTEQIQERYNRQKAYIIPTLQNYLKTAKERVDYEIELARRRNLWFGIKLVRGAYLVEETQLALKNKKESPIVPCFDSTTENYLGNFAKIIGSGLKGEIFLAGHNQQTIQALLQIKSKNTTNLKINFAQLYGLGDHLTYLLKRQRENVYKLLPWAQTEVMVPYMIRRAQELSQMRYPLDTQSALLRHQLAYRIFPY